MYNGFLNTEELESMRKCFPTGTRLMLISMDDPFSTLKYGDKGTVKYIDDAGQIHMDWDSGSSLALIPGIDNYRMI